MLPFGAVAWFALALTSAAFARSIDIEDPQTPTYIEDINLFDDFTQASPPVAAPPVVVPPVTTPPVTTPPPGTPPTVTEPPVEDLTQPDPNAHIHDDEEPSEDVNIGEIPLIETMELTEDIARKALDAFVLVREKYKDAEFENYENLQDFVDQNTLGKTFEADIKLFGFANVSDWNLAISTLGFAYNNSLDDQTEDVKQQIEEVIADQELAQDMKDRMVTSLNAMLPSPNNVAVLEIMLKEAVYAEKLKLLENAGE